MKPHHTDRISLVFGLLFLGAAGLWLLAQFVVLHPAVIAMLVAAGLVMVGIIGLLHTILSDRHRDHPGAERDQAGGDRPGV